MSSGDQVGLFWLELESFVLLQEVRARGHVQVLLGGIENPGPVVFEVAVHAISTAPGDFDGQLESPFVSGRLITGDKALGKRKVVARFQPLLQPCPVTPGVHQEEMPILADSHAVKAINQLCKAGLDVRIAGLCIHEGEPQETSPLGPHRCLVPGPGSLGDIQQPIVFEARIQVAEDPLLDIMCTREDRHAATIFYGLNEAAVAIAVVPGTPLEIG